MGCSESHRGGESRREHGRNDPSSNQPNLDGKDHISVYDVDYLMENVAGGEGYDWYYASDLARDQQNRTSIYDGAYGEDWIYRYKDLVNWWKHPHFERKHGVKASTPTQWQAESKPIRFTEYGCAAIDLGTNQPNVFLDKNSSENAKPYYSSGAPDSLMQMQYLRAILSYWARSENNPISSVYNGNMLDTFHAYAWTWDARPWPYFPQFLEIWSDGENYKTGHWLGGRVLSPSLAQVVREVCAQAGISDIDVSKLYGVVNGVAFSSHETPKYKLDLLARIYNFHASYRDGVLVFESFTSQEPTELTKDHIVWEGESKIETEIDGTRSAFEAVEVKFISSEDDYELAVENAYKTGSKGQNKARIEFPAILSRQEARALGRYYLKSSDARRISRKFTLPLAYLHLVTGDIVRFDDEDIHWQITNIDISNVLNIEVERVFPDAPIGLGNTLALGAKIPTNHSPYWVELLPMPRGDRATSSHAIAISKSAWKKAILTVNQKNGITGAIVAKAPSVMGYVRETYPSSYAGFINSKDLHVSFQTDFPALNEGSFDAPSNILAVNIGERWEYVGFQSHSEYSPREITFKGITRGLFGDELVCASIPQNAKIVFLGAPLHNIGANEVESFAVAPADTPSQSKTVFVNPKTLAKQKKALKPTQFRAKIDGNAIDLSWYARDIADDDKWNIANLGIGVHYHLLLYKNGHQVGEDILSQPQFTIPQSQNVDEVALALITAQNQISDYERFVINDDIN